MCVFLVVVALAVVSSFSVDMDISGQATESIGLPLAELHLHLGGSWPISYLSDLAAGDALKPLEDLLHSIESEGVDYHDGFKAFDLVSRLINDESKVTAGVMALCDELLLDNVGYVEIRTGLRDINRGLEAYLEAVLDGIALGCPGIETKVVLSLRRDSSRQLAVQTINLIRKNRHRGVIGLDISGDSTIGDGSEVMQVFNEMVNSHDLWDKGAARDDVERESMRGTELNDIPVTIHMGESPKETVDQQLRELSVFRPKRIGHAVHLTEPAWEYVKTFRVPVEMCLTSAQRVGMIKEYAHHPGLELLREGHPVVIATDDPLIFRTTLTREIAIAAEALGMSLDAMRPLLESAHLYKLDQIKDADVNAM